MCLLDNEIDGLTLRNVSETDIQKMMCEKIGPAKKLTLIVDGVKAKFIASTTDDLPLGPNVEATCNARPLTPSASNQPQPSGKSQELVC